MSFSVSSHQRSGRSFKMRYFYLLPLPGVNGSLVGDERGFEITPKRVACVCVCETERERVIGGGGVVRVKKMHTLLQIC